MPVNVDQYLHIETLKIGKTPLKMKKKYVSDFDEIQNMQSLWPKDFTQEIWVDSETKNFSDSKIFFCLRFHSNFICKILRPWGFQILSFIKKKFFGFFPISPNARGPQKFSKSDSLNFLEKKFKSSSTGCWQITKGTKSEILVILVLALKKCQKGLWSSRP